MDSLMQGKGVAIEMKKVQMFWLNPTSVLRVRIFGRVRTNLRVRVMVRVRITGCVRKLVEMAKIHFEL